MLADPNQQVKHVRRDYDCPVKLACSKTTMEFAKTRLKLDEKWGAGGGTVERECRVALEAEVRELREGLKAKRLSKAVERVD